VARGMVVSSSDSETPGIVPSAARILSLGFTAISDRK
jgi:hypothetical protein